MQFDRSFESKAESTVELKAESKAECVAYFKVVIKLSVFFLPIRSSNMHNSLKTYKIEIVQKSGFSNY